MAPTAVAIGRYSAEQVATVMGTVRHLIVTSLLNRYVIETHDAEPVLALLVPHQAESAASSIRSIALPRGIIAPGYSDPTTVRPHGPNAPPESYFDPNAPLQTIGGCRSIGEGEGCHLEYVVGQHN
ncbi:hypothetical protein ACFWBG_23990 [Nocardia salmonicida]|uniref:hypothetical protein n=1 Tax=Nocardia salmonicida TaxID=53431 RepID=UPI00366E2421